MNRACYSQSAILHEQNQHASSIRPLKSNFVRIKTVLVLIAMVCVPLFAQPDNNRSEVRVIPSESVLAAEATLGEGSLWDHVRNRLLWVDIDRGLLHIYNPSDATNQTYSLGKKVGTVVPVYKSDKVVVALEDGVYGFTPGDEAPALWVESPEKSTTRNRFNDGKCDPAGRLWVGTLGGRFSAALYRLEDGPVRSMVPMVDSVTISNGIVWSADKKRMYYVDTPTNEVKEYAYNDKTGEIRFTRVAVKIPRDMGSPDGMTIDSEGKLWVAHWGGYCVGCWNPETGQLEAKVEVASAQVTSCAFGGPNLDILYITTARTGIRGDALTKYPLSGNLFMAKPGVKGVKASYFIER